MGGSAQRPVPLVFMSTPPPRDTSRTQGRWAFSLTRLPHSQAISDRVMGILQTEYEASKTYIPKAKDWLVSLPARPGRPCPSPLIRSLCSDSLPLQSSYWSGFKGPDQMSRIRNTGIPMETLMDIGRRITTVPPEFNAHKQVRKIYEDRRKMFESENGQLDWGTAELLAFGTMLREGNHVRLAGQDVERGTFSHRHAVLHDQETGSRLIPMVNAFDGYTPRQFTITNSSLSEFGESSFGGAHLNSSPLGHHHECLPQRARSQRKLDYDAPPPPQVSLDTSSGIRWRTRTRWSSGRPSSETLPTAPRSSLTSSCRQERPSGSGRPASSASCRTAMTARAPSTRRRAWSASCRCATRTPTRSPGLTSPSGSAVATWAPRSRHITGRRGMGRVYRPLLRVGGTVVGCYSVLLGGLYLPDPDHRSNSPGTRLVGVWGALGLMRLCPQSSFRFVPEAGVQHHHPCQLLPRPPPPAAP